MAFAKRGKLHMPQGIHMLHIWLRRGATGRDATGRDAASHTTHGEALWRNNTLAARCQVIDTITMTNTQSDFWGWGLSAWPLMNSINK